ncbi:MAG: putative quinol monooxygenase [Pseudomonadota bacterium]
MPTDDYAVMIELLARPGQEGALVQACRELAPLCRAQPGCRVWLPLRHGREIRRILIFTTWSDEAAFQAHLASPHLLDFRERLAPWLLEGGLTTTVMRVLA